MKTINILIVSIISILLVVACSSETENTKELNTKISEKKHIYDVPDLEMNKDTVSNRISKTLNHELSEARAKLTEDALSTISETELFLQSIEDKQYGEAINKGEILVGKIEVILAQDPNLALIPIDIKVEKNELITDLEIIDQATEDAKKAMDNGYYQIASDILNQLKSELVISTYLLPTTSYPKAIKNAVILLKSDKPELAEALINHVLSTIVIEKHIQPLPVLKAEQMVIEAATIDKKDHNNVQQVNNLLENANYQLTLAEAMGYGKRDMDFKNLSESIEKLKRSVVNKENSERKFDSLKQDIRNFKQRLFSAIAD